MRISAESFAGRMLAVVARRSPGFRAAERPDAREAPAKIAPEPRQAAVASSHGVELSGAGDGRSGSGDGMGATEPVRQRSTTLTADPPDAVTGEDAAAGQRPDEPPAGRSRREIRLALAGLLVALFPAAIDQAATLTAGRTIADDLGGFDVLAWLTTAYLGTSAVMALLYVKLSDRFAPRPLLLSALGLFLVGSVLGGLSSDMVELAGSRAIQGAGAGGLLPLTWAMLSDLMPPPERARYQRLFGAFFFGAALAGPLLGGVLAEAGWRWLFFGNVPVVLLAAVLLLRVPRLDHIRFGHAIDWQGAIALLGLGMPLLVATASGAWWSWGSGDAIFCYVFGGIMLLAVLACEWAHGDDALLPLRILRHRTAGLVLVANALIGAAVLTVLVAASLYLQLVKGSSPVATGGWMCAFAVGATVGSAVAGRTSHYRRPAVAGCALMTVALTLFTLVGADTPVGLTVPFLALMGLGLGAVVQPSTLAAQNAVPPRDIGVVKHLVTFFRAAGGTIGATVAFAVVVHQSGELGEMRIAYDDGLHAAFLVALAAMVLGLIMALFVRGVPPSVLAARLAEDADAVKPCRR
jgi:MFS family permease